MVTKQEPVFEPTGFRSYTERCWLRVLVQLMHRLFIVLLSGAKLKPIRPFFYLLQAAYLVLLWRLSNLTQGMIGV